jgi:hypothetical protein
MIKSTQYTTIYPEDKPGDGNANHLYSIVEERPDSTQVLAKIKFQKGPIQEVGVNGVQNEDLLNIVIHRLQGFQSSNFSCRENALALTKIQEALHWLNHRTAERVARGVEGRSVV